MAAPTDRALLKWWDDQAARLRAAGITTLTCADCGRVDSSSYVQPQHPYYADGRENVARCGDCINARNERRRLERRAELAQRPNDCARCGRRPHTYLVAGVKLCGRCKTATMREHYAATSRLGILSMLVTRPAMDTSTWVTKG